MASWSEVNCKFGLQEDVSCLNLKGQHVQSAETSISYIRTWHLILQLRCLLYWVYGHWLEWSPSPIFSTRFVGDPEETGHGKEASWLLKTIDNEDDEDKMSQRFEVKEDMLVFCPAVFSACKMRRFFVRQFNSRFHSLKVLLPPSLTCLLLRRVEAFLVSLMFFQRSR